LEISPRYDVSKRPTDYLRAPVEKKGRGSMAMLGISRQIEVTGWSFASEDNEVGPSTAHPDEDDQYCIDCGKLLCERVNLSASRILTRQVVHCCADK
jgi:hypothetical protein